MLTDCWKLSKDSATHALNASRDGRGACVAAGTVADDDDDDDGEVSSESLLTRSANCTNSLRYPSWFWCRMDTSRTMSTLSEYDAAAAAAAFANLNDDESVPRRRYLRSRARDGSDMKAGSLYFDNAAASGMAEGRTAETAVTAVTATMTAPRAVDDVARLKGTRQKRSGPPKRRTIRIGGGPDG